MRSNFERTIAASLRSRGIKFEYESEQLEYYTKVRGGCCWECGSEGECYQRRWYTPDFIIRRNKSIKARDDLYIETKGKFTSRDRSKMVDVKKAHPDLDIRFVFMRDNYLSKRSKIRYSDWAIQNNFEYAIGDIPDEWLT